MRGWGKWPIVFACVQALGLLCMWTWQHAQSTVLWGTSLITLFPGNLLSAALVEKMLWGSRLSLSAMSAIEVPVLIVINAALWFSGVAILRTLFFSRSRQVDVR